MACLNITNGAFVVVAWQQGTAPVTTPAGATVTNTTSGANPGVVVQKGTSSQFFSKPPTGQMHFMVFGNPANYILVLTVDGTSGTRSVVLVDTTGATIHTVLLVTVAAPSTTNLPIVQSSPGNGSVFLLDASNGSTVSAMMVRSDNGTVLCSVSPFVPTQVINGEATATQLLIKQGGTTVNACSRPAGVCDATPDPRTFPDAVLGAADPALATRVAQVTIRNTGDDCLTITAIGNVAPYTVVNPSPAFGTALDPMQSMTVDVRFAPTAVGTFNIDLPITRSPANGDSVIHCRGNARAATTSLTFSGAIDFGSVPL